MKKDIVFPGFHSYENVLDIEECQKFISDIKDTEYTASKNAPHSLLLEKNSTFFKFIEESIKPYLYDYFKDYNIFMDDDRGYMIMKYDQAMRLGGHSDDHGKYNDPKPRLSLVFYINENYDGGEIKFKNLDISIKPKSNQLIIFPSSYLFFHTISKVTKGQRFIITNFYS